MKHSNLSKAIAITARAFEDKFDKGGEPYILHCLNVMNQMPQTDYKARMIAVMHDLIEDTHWTAENLNNIGFNPTVVTTIELLTHVKGITYEEYIKAISTDHRAILVKMADLRHNSDITRLKGLRDKDIARVKKYNKAYLYLKNVLEKEYET